MKKTHKTIWYTVIGMMIVAIIVVWGFYYVTQNKMSESEDVPTTEAQKLIKKDIEGNYPGTPREVLKLYFRITQCMYNDEMTEDEQVALSDQLRMLFDEELLETNERDAFYANLSADITNFRDNEERITSYDVELGSETEYSTIKGDDYAELKATLLMQKTGAKKSFSKTCEQFLFRQDEKGQWKIAHWQLSNEENE